LDSNDSKRKLIRSYARCYLNIARTLKVVVVQIADGIQA